MSSKRRLVKHFGRKSGPRKALIRGLMVSLVEHGRIKTTIAKAKELRKHIERVITLGKKDNLNSIRLISSRLCNPDAAVDLVKTIAPRFKDRDGGYTRVIKIGRRPGDSAEMAFLEFVDFDYKSKESKEMAPTVKKSGTKKDAKKDLKKEDKTELKTVSKAKSVKSLLAAKTKKGIRQMKNKSRADSYANNR